MNWTFGIVTSQDTNEFVSEMIDQIEAQQIPNYEIIIVGNYFHLRKNTTVLTFDEYIKNGWISRKKNIICQTARFNNICLLHDYISLGNNWYTGFQQFGEDWDVCMTPVVNLDGSRFRDWVTWEPIRQVPYDDHRYIRQMYVSGSYYCIKKEFALQHPINEALGWGESEDVEWSLRVRSFWNYRCNKDSPVRLLKFKNRWFEHELPV